jgi:hypothetical protein
LPDDARATARAPADPPLKISVLRRIVEAIEQARERGSFADELPDVIRAVMG